jgi:hypothetical protein
MVQAPKSLSAKANRKFPLLLSKCDVMKTCGGSGDVEPRILKIGSVWRWTVRFTLRQLHSRLWYPWYPFDGKLDGLHNQYGHSEVEIRVLLLQGIELWFISHSACSLVITPADLSRLNNHVNLTTSFYVRVFLNSGILLGKPEGKTPLGGHKRRWEDNVKMHLR